MKKPGSSTSFVKRFALNGLASIPFWLATSIWAAPPQVTSTPITDGQIEQPYSYQVTAEDPEGGPLSYSLFIGLDGMTISSDGLVSWVPSVAQSGKQLYKVQVQDQEGLSAYHYVEVSVFDPNNQPPLIGQEPIATGQIGQTYSYDLNASDADGDPLTYSMWSWPSMPGIALSNEGVLEWSPVEHDMAGEYWVNVEVNDGRLGKDVRQFKLRMEDPNNQLPIFGQEPVLETNVGENYIYDPQVTDGDGDTLGYSLITWPTGLGVQLSSSGIVTWTPTRDHVGENWIVIRVDDTNLGLAEKGFKLMVLDPNNQDPVFTSTAPNQVQVGSQYVYVPTATDPDGDDVQINVYQGPSGMQFDSNTDTITWTPNSLPYNGQAEVIVDARDAIGGFARQEFIIYVNESGGAGDADGDGVPDTQDAFPSDPTESVDTDGDGIGNNADTDDDGDGVVDGEDDFPLDPAETTDTDSDGVGNNADTDDDNDGVLDVDDAFPLNAAESSDLDGDGIGDNSDSDRDGDGVNNEQDAFPNNPAETTDTDGDGIGNNADTDDDEDGVLDEDDAFPLNENESVDTDGDGIGNNADTDDDGDGVADTEDAFPLDGTESSDLDNDGVGDNSDLDRDGDGVDNSQDAFPNDPSETEDTDNDGLGNNTDPDDDNDGVADINDAFPRDPTETSDFDGDGIGDNADTDRDGDGVPNVDDAFPDDPSASSDLDGDGVPDGIDPDRDGDGVDDVDDAFPGDPTETIDSDLDGIGNNADPDDDNDGVADASDAFPLDPSETFDTDSDGIGNNADTDDDGDGVLDVNDDLPLDPNETVDTDGDGIGNNADTDDDNDSVLDINDAFPLDSSESQDTDGDGVGNNTDTDDDNDGVADINDSFPLDPLETTDTDGDGIGNNTDDDDDGDGVLDVNDAFPVDPNETIDTDNDGVGNNTDSDDDNDGVVDTNDAFPLDATESADTDNDGIGNNTDTDDDADGVLDVDDAFPLDPGESSDLDGDGIGDNSDTDRDGDGVPNVDDAFPDDPNSNADQDGDGIPDETDPDRDGDGVDNAQDAFPGDPSESVDTDSDGIGNNSDNDDDNDGVLDAADAFPLDASESIDTDNDGVGNNADTDDDNDGVLDTDDAFPLNSSESEDFDGDGVGDNADPDDDNDGVEDVNDAFPRNAAESSDLDGDGIGDNADTDRDGDGVENTQDVFPDDATEWADLDGDGIGDNSDPDIDGDGVPNVDDAFPTNGALSQLPPVSQFGVAVQTDQVQIDWTPAATYAAMVDGYRIYRGGLDASTSTLLTTVSATASSFTDTTAENGQAYGYRVAAITAEQLEGESSAYETVFIAYNTAAISGLALDDSSGNVVLSWDDAGVDGYRIYRSINGGSFDFLSEETAATYIDSAPSLGSVYAYRIATVRNFTNPINSAAVTELGPQSNEVSVGTQQAIEAQLENIEVLSEGAYQTVVFTSQVSVSGSYTNVVTAVSVTATRGGDTVSSTSTSGQFQLALPFTQSGEVWNIVVAQESNPTNQVVLSLTLLADTNAPVVNLSETNVTTNADAYGFSGTVSDDSNGELTLSATSNRFSGTEFQVNEASGQISASIPLLSGENIITVTATDASNNSGSAQLTVTRNVNEAPVIDITSPSSGLRTTAETIDIQGVVYTSLEANDVRISLGGDLIFPSSTPADDAYDFAFNNRSLAEGVNSFTVQVETPAGTQSSTVSVTRIVEVQEPPELTVSEPVSVLYSRDNIVNVAGYVSGGALPVTVNINAVEVAQLDSGGIQNFQSLVDISAFEGEHVITVEVVDADGLRDETTLSVIRDVTTPDVTITSPEVTAAAGGVIQVTEVPYPLQGTVDEANIAALTIANQSVELRPTAISGQFEFNAALNLPAGLDETVTLVALDLAGNEQSFDYTFNASPETTVDLVSPRQGANLALSASAAEVAVLARLSQVEVGFTASVSIDNATPVPVTIDSSVIDAQIPVDISTDEHELVLEVRNALDQVVAVARRQFTTENLDDIPLEVRVDPANGAENVNPNDSLKLYFNRPIDPGLLEIEVRESVNGLTIIVERNDNPTDFPSVDNAEPVQVSRVQELVPGESGVLTGNTVAIFHPSRIYAYGAELFVMVRYNGEQLSRSTFKVRAIPTFMQATVVDQQGQPLKGIPVEIPEKGLKTYTNANGSYSFGFGLPAEKQLSGGQVKLVFNRNNEVSSFGEVRNFVYLQSGHLNRVGTALVPLLSKNIPYRPIISGQQSAVLANGELTLDLSQAELLFPDGRNRGSVHVQFASTSKLSHGMLRSAMPQWVFAMQPAGIEVDGPMDVVLKAPALSGSHDYLPVDPVYVLMVGLDPDTLSIVPTGVGVLENKEVRATLTQQTTLDYFGYSILAIDQQKLKDTMEGRMTLEALISELDSSL